MRRNEITEYAADMNLLLAYYHLEDDWADEKKPAALAGKGVLRKKADRIIRKYPRQSRVIGAPLWGIESEKRKLYGSGPGLRVLRADDGRAFCLQKGCMGKNASKNRIFSRKVHLSDGRVR